MYIKYELLLTVHKSNADVFSNDNRNTKIIQNDKQKNKQELT